MREILMYVSATFSAVLFLFALMFVLSPVEGDFAAGNLFAAFLMMPAIPLGLVALGCWLAGRNENGDASTTLSLDRDKD